MKLKELHRWNFRLSVVYAVGIWTMVGSYVYIRMHSKKDEVVNIPQSALEEELVDSLAVPEKQEERKTGPRVKNTVVYKENFVPFSSRVYNFVKPLFGTTHNATTEKDFEEK
ncbi:small integral membrane protein 26 [Rhinophrynus dorsalis]